MIKTALCMRRAVKTDSNNSKYSVATRLRYGDQDIVNCNVIRDLPLIIFETIRHRDLRSFEIRF